MRDEREHKKDIPARIDEKSSHIETIGNVRPESSRRTLRKIDQRSSTIVFIKQIVRKKKEKKKDFFAKKKLMLTSRYKLFQC